MRKLTIGIAGAGLMGSLLAWQLTKQGYKVALYEKQQLCHRKQAATVAAGMLSPYAELPVANNEVFELGQRSLTLWPEILSELNLLESFNNKGSLTIADDTARLEHYIKKIIVQKSKVTLNRCKSTTLEPEIQQEAYFFPEEASLNTQLFMTIVSKWLRKNCNVHEFIEVEHVAEGTIVTNSGSEKYDLVIDCRGTGAQSNFNNLRAVRGELIHVVAPEVKLSRPIRYLNNKGIIYIVPRNNHEYVIGASEIEADDESEVSVRTCVELLATAYQVHSGFSEARIKAMETACRPALSDNLPVIKYLNKTIAVNGLYRHGYLVAPALVEQIKREL